MTIAVGALGLSGATPSNGLADWAVHRSANALVEQGARALVARPEDDVLAARVVRELGRKGIELALARFERRVVEQPESYGVQLAYAQLLLAAGRWGQAVSRFKNAQDLSPSALAPRWGLARALGRGGDAHAASTELRAALTLARGSDQIRRLARELVIAATGIGDADAEIEARRAWAHADSTNRKLAFDLALALARWGRPGEAADVLAGMGNATGGSDADRAGWALAEGKNRAAAGDLAGASLVLKCALGKVPAANIDLRREIWELGIDIARRRGTLDELKVVVAHPRDAVEWSALARISDDRGDPSSARAALDEAIRLAPRDLDLHRRRIAIVRRLGSVRDVVGLYQDLAHVAARVGGDTSGVIAETLQELWRIGRTDVAGRIFDQALASGASRVVLLRVLAETAGQWGDNRRATLAWTALLRRNPRDELAVIALGEAQFQRGQRRGALETWRNILRMGDSPVGAHVRLGELLAEHDFEGEAIGEARAAMTEDPGEPGPHRLMATILERQHRLRDAEEEWNTALRLASGPARAALRREVRGCLVTLWLRQGSARADAGLRELERDARRDDRDREAWTFLVEAELRVGRTDDAMAILRTVQSRGGDVSDADVDLILLLVRALRQARRTEEAASWLEEMARRWPERAHDALLQLSDIALGGHADARALTFAERAAATAPGDPRVLLRVAGVEERIGHLDDALAAYRRVVSGTHDPSGILALTGLLARRGETQEQRSLLREVLRDGRDEEIVSAAGRRAIALEEAGGTLEALEAFVAELSEPTPVGAGVSARQRVLVAILARLVPEAYRNQPRDAASTAMLDRFARHGVRPLLDSVATSDTESDVGAVEILGMLGRRAVVPVLVALIAPDSGAGDGSSGTRARLVPRDDLANAVVIALGRLGGDGARAALEAVAVSRRPVLRLAVLWALGRVGAESVVPLARQELAGGGIDGAVVGCLSLGRAGGPDAAPLLLSVALDPARPELVRRGAMLGLALGRHVDAIPALLGLVDSSDRAVATTAATAIAIVGGGADAGTRDRLTHSLVERIASTTLRPGTDGARARLGCSVARHAVERMAAGGSPSDDALGVVGARIEPEALLRALEEPARCDPGGDVPGPAQPGGTERRQEPSGLGRLRLDLPR